MRFRHALYRLLLLLPAVLTADPVHSGECLHAQPWSAEVFRAAAAARKPVLVDLGAKWCHWCHVMDERTYADPRVAKLIRENFVFVRADQDARPDLASRYEDYGWPATVVFDASGREIVKRAGYIRADAMIEILNDVIAGRIREETPSRRDLESDFRKSGETPVAELRACWLAGYDDAKGGWGVSHKFLDADTVEYALREASAGNGRAAAMASATLRLQLRLHDPVWGGAWQYSAGGDWNEPHYEKLLLTQADNVRIYARAYAASGDKSYLEASLATWRYVRRFLTGPGDVVYASQDADLNPGKHAADYFALPDGARLRLGVPRVDRHVYARENGAWCVALVALAESTGDPLYAAEARRIALRMIATHGTGDGGFRHAEKDTGGPYLTDTLAMGRAFLALREITGEHAWTVRAEAAAKFIRKHFPPASAEGFAAAAATSGTFPEPLPQYDENVGVARFSSALFRLTGNPEYREIAEQALRFVLAPGNAATRGYYVGGALLARHEFFSEPLHVMITGPSASPVFAALWREALRYPDSHRLIETWDPAVGAAPRGEADYPRSETPAAFLCTAGTCSSPIETPENLRVRLLAAASKTTL